MRASLNKSALLTLSLLSTLGALNTPAQDTRRQKPEQPQQRSQYRDQAQPLMQDTQQKDARSFAGTISQKQGTFYLEEEFHRRTFELTDAWEARRFVGRTVRITGALLDSEKNILRVIAITAIPGGQAYPMKRPACSTPP